MYIRVDLKDNTTQEIAVKIARDILDIMRPYSTHVSIQETPKPWGRRGPKHIDWVFPLEPTKQ